MDAEVATDERNSSGRQRRVGLTPRRWRQVLEKQFLRDDGGKKARSPGRARYKPVETTAQGKSGCLRWTCMLVCVFFVQSCTRDRGCSAHPAFPAPSLFQRVAIDSKPRATRAARSRTRICCLKFESEPHSVIARSALVRRSPPSGEGGCDEAIHLSSDATVKWIASLRSQ